jgi:hypothetical protein
MVLTVTALQQESVMKSITVAVFALLAGAPTRRRWLAIAVMTGLGIPPPIR